MNADEIGDGDTMLNAVKYLSPRVNDYKNAIEDVFTTAADANQNPMDEYFVIFVGKRKDKVDIAGASSGNTSNSTTDNADIYETFCTYKSSQLDEEEISSTTIIVKKDNENPIVLYNRDNKMLKAKSDNIFHLIDTIVSPVLGQQIGDSGMNVAQKIFFKGLPATPPGGNPPVQVTGAGGDGEGGNGAGEDGEGGNRAGGDRAEGGPGTDPEENPETTVAAATNTSGAVTNPVTNPVTPPPPPSGGGGTA